MELGYAVYHAMMVRGYEEAAAYLHARWAEYTEQERIKIARAWELVA